jgi:hypothetical protein
LEDGFKHRRDKGVSSPPEQIAMDGVPTPMFMESSELTTTVNGVQYYYITETEEKYEVEAA